MAEWTDEEFDTLRAAAGDGSHDAARTLGHRLCLLREAVSLETPDDVPEAERWLRQALGDRPGDPVTATLLAGLLLRQYRTTLELSPLYDGYGKPGTGRSAWLRSLWGRRSEAYDWYLRALDADPADVAAACGLAVLALEEPFADDFNYNRDDEDAGVDEDAYDERDPAWLPEAARRLRLVLRHRPGDAGVTAYLADVERQLG